MRLTFNQYFKIVLKTKLFYNFYSENRLKNCANQSNSFYITERWLGGTLTNWTTIKTCINKLKLLNKIENINKLTKKEILVLTKRKKNET